MAKNLKKRRRREHIINKHSPPPPSIKKDSTCTKHNCLLGNFFKLNYIKDFFPLFIFLLFKFSFLLLNCFVCEGGGVGYLVSNLVSLLK